MWLFFNPWRTLKWSLTSHLCADSLISGVRQRCSMTLTLQQNAICKLTITDDVPGTACQSKAVLKRVPVRLEWGVKLKKGVCILLKPSITCSFLN